MGEWAEEILTEEPGDPSAGQGGAQRVDWAEEVTAQPETTAAEPKKPIGQGREVDTYASFVAGLASNEQELVRHLAKQLYPDEPIEQAAQRFGKREGILFHKGDDGKLYEALPRGMDIGHALRVMAESAPMIAGATAGMAATPLTPMASVAVAGGVGGATEIGRQKLGDTLMGDASTGDLDKLKVAEETILNATGQGIGKGFEAMATSRAVRDLDQLNPAQTQQAYREAEAVDVPITPAEATELPTLAAQQKRLTNITPTANKMRSFLEERGEKVISAWSRMLDDISRLGDAEGVGIKARDAAKGALKDMRDELKMAAKPLYDAAYAKPVPYTEALEELLQRPIMAEALAKARNLAANEGIPFNQFFAEIADDGAVTIARVPDMRGWDYVKRGLDEVLGSDQVLNKKTGGFNNLGRIVGKIRSELLGHLDDAVPEYAQARALYSEGAEEITTAMESALNILAKTKDVNILTAARNLFDPARRSPKMVRKLRTAIEGKDRAAWQGIKRLYMNDVSIQALRITEAGEIANPAGKLFKAFSHPKVQANLHAAMTPREWRNFKDLLVVYRRAARVPMLRSDTEFNRLMSQEAERAARPLGAKIADIASKANPMGTDFLGLKQLGEWITERNLTRHAEQAVDIIISGDENAIDLMKELRRLSPSDKRWLSLFGQLVGRGTFSLASDLLPEPDYTPYQ